MPKKKGKGGADASEQLRVMMQAQINKYEEEIKQLRTDRDNQLQEVVRAQYEQKHREEELNLLNAKLHEREEHIKALELSTASQRDKLVNELEKELNVEDQEKRQLVTEKEQLQQSCKELINKNVELEKQLWAAQNETTQLRDMLEGADKERLQFRQENEDLDQKCVVLEEENVEIRRQLEVEVYSRTRRTGILHHINAVLQSLRRLVPSNFCLVDETRELYQFGTKQISLQVIKGVSGEDELMVAVGRGYLSFQDYVLKYGMMEKQKMASDNLCDGMSADIPMMTVGSVPQKPTSASPRKGRPMSAVVRH